MTTQRQNKAAGNRASGLGNQRPAAALSVLAALIWPVQAAVVAAALGALLAYAPVQPLLAAGTFALLGVLRALLNHLAESRAQATADRVITDLRTTIVTQEAQRIDDNPFGGAGAIAALASEKLDLLGPYLTRYALARARTMVLPLVILALAFWHSWAVGVILLLAGPLIPVFMALIGLAAKETSARQLAEVGTLNDLLVERLSALVDIRLLGAQEAVLGDFARRAGDLRQRTMAVLRVAFLSSTVLELFAAIGVAMVAVYVGFSLLGALDFGTWGAPLSPEQGIFLLLLAPDFFQPLRDLSAAWHDKAAADAVLDEVDAHATPAMLPLAGAGGRSAPLPGPASVALLGCLTPAGRALPEITIRAGEKVALIGPSGSGKTSALHLMAGLSLPAQGRVLVAGQDLSHANAESWRARLGWMPQSVHFLTGSLRSNLRMGRDGSTDRALRIAAISDVVAALPKGLATRLGETGGGLSGGEARRLTLARALHGSPDVILADEPTADLDAETAALVADGLLAEAARGATLVIATHDLDLAARMDRTIDLGIGA
jgi:ATP-binding cassette, subfamily C, bacterial CydD